MEISSSMIRRQFNGLKLAMNMPEKRLVKNCEKQFLSEMLYTTQQSSDQAPPQIFMKIHFSLLNSTVRLSPVPYSETERLVHNLELEAHGTATKSMIFDFQPIEEMESNLNMGVELAMTPTSNYVESISKLASRPWCTGNMIAGIPCKPQCDDEADSFDALVSELFLEEASMYQYYIPIEPLDPNNEILIEISSILSAFLNETL